MRAPSVFLKSRVNDSLYALLRAGDLPSVVIGCWLTQVKYFLRPLESAFALVSPAPNEY
jgi:hypothetical protein